MKRLGLFLWHLGRHGGGPRYTLELARELAQRDDVELHLSLSRQSDLFAETAALGTPVLAVDTYNGPAGFAAGLLRVPAIAGRMRAYVECRRLPVALCSMAHLWNGLLAPALKKAGAANCLVVHDAMPHAGDNYGIRHLMIARDIRQADAVITVSDAVRRHLIERHGYPRERAWASTIGPFRYGGDQASRPRRLGPPPHRLLFFGRLLPYKGLDCLIEAMRLLDGRGVAARLRVVGDGSTDLPPLPANVEVDRRWIPEAEIPSLFADVDLVALPYRETSQSGVIPIAHHFGVPPVVTPLAGLLEQAKGGRCGFVAADHSAVALADAIQDALADPQRYARMSADILDDDSNAQWAAAADQMVGILRAVAERKAWASPSPCPSPSDGGEGTCT